MSGPARPRPPAAPAAQPSAAELLAWAEQVLTLQAAGLGGARARAAAILARQAIEAALAELWAARGLAPLVGCPLRAQLLCLGGVLGDRGLAAEAAQLWGVLSGACHHHPYELAPTAQELAAWVAAAGGVLGRLAAHARPGGQGRAASGRPGWA